ncbi:MAG: ABC transporter ATP-binding protein [Acidimicrobiales bacterium]
MTLRGVSHDYRAKRRSIPALRDVDLVIDVGEFVCVVGPSGCGKTTLLQLLAGFLHPTQGEILVGGTPVGGPSPDRGVVFQQANLFPWLDVRGNVEFGPRMRHLPAAERRERSARYLDLVGLSDFGQVRPYELSGGMQQRCQIARVLANDPDIMLLDEPFGALDALTRERLQDELRRVWSGSDKTALFITHSVEEAVYLGTRVLVMSPRPGRIVFDAEVPFAHEDHDGALRTTTDFVAFRQLVSSHLGSATDH